MVNTEKLNQAVKTSGYRKNYIADQLGITRQSLSGKINNRIEFRAREACILKELLHLNAECFVAIFFANDCELHSHSEGV